MNDVIPFLESKMLPCTTKYWLGFDCPGCGIQRAFIALLKGDLLGSLQLYPALIPLLLFFSLLTSSLIFSNQRLLHLTQITGILSGILVVINYIYKVVIHFF